MAAELQNIDHIAGKYRVLKFGPIKNRLGDLVAFPGATATWRMAKAATSTGADVLIAKDTGSSGGVFIDLADWYGQPAYSVRVIIESEDTVDLPPCVPPNKYYHECEVTTAEGHPVTVSTGYFVLKPSITN